MKPIKTIQKTFIKGTNGQLLETLTIYTQVNELIILLPSPEKKGIVFKDDRNALFTDFTSLSEQLQNEIIEYVKKEEAGFCQTFYRNFLSKGDRENLASKGIYCQIWRNIQFFKMEDPNIENFQINTIDYEVINLIPIKDAQYNGLATCFFPGIPAGECKLFSSLPMVLKNEVIEHIINHPREELRELFKTEYLPTESKKLLDYHQSRKLY